MTRPKILLACFLATSFVSQIVSSSDGQAHAAASGHEAREEELNRRGVELRKAGDDAGARTVFQEAYDGFRSPRAAAQLGLVEQALGRWEDAEGHVAEGLRAPNDPWIAKYKATLDEALTAIRRHVARIEINGEPAGAEIFVNGRSIGRLPLPRAVTVTIGQVDIECRAPGRRTTVRQLTMGAAQYERVFIRMESEGGASASSTSTTTTVAPVVGAPKNDESTGGRVGSTAADGGGKAVTSPPPVSNETVGPRTVVKWSSLGLAATGLGTGIVGSIIYQQKLSDFQSANGGNCRDNGGRAVDTSNTPVAACQTLLNAANSARTVQIVGFVAAGVFAATWAVLQLTEPEATSSTSAASSSGARRARTASASANWACVPQLSPAGTGLDCALRF